MSTNNTNPTLGATDEEITAYVRQIAAEEAAKQSGKPLASSEPEPLKMNIGGQDHSFKDLNEAQAFMNNTIGQFQTELSRRQEPEVKGRKTPAENDTFDQKRYVDYMVEDPRKAADYLDEARGIKDLARTLRETQEQVRSLATEAVVNNFAMKHPDWEATPENAKVMQDTMVSLGLGNIVSPASLEAAFAVAKAHGHIKTSQQESRPRQDSAAFTPPVAARAQRSANIDQDLASQFEDMSMEQLEKVARRYGAI